MTRRSKQGPDDSKEVIRAHHYMVDQGEASHDQFLPQGMVICLWPHKLNFAQLDHAPDIRRELSNRHHILVDADKVPRLEPAVAGPGHRDGLISVGHGERPVCVDSAEPFLRHDAIFATVHFIFGVDVEEM